MTSKIKFITFKSITMKKLFTVFLMLTFIMLTSCSADDSLERLSPGTHTFVLESSTELSLLALRLNDADSNTIKQYTFSDVYSVSVTVDVGTEMMIFVQDQGFYEYNYQMYNPDGSLQFEGIGQGFNSNTVVINYEL